MKPDNTSQLAKLQTCLKDIKILMISNFLLLNSDKTKVMVLGLQPLRNTLSNDIVTLDGIVLASSTTIRKLWSFFDQEISFNSHIKQGLTLFTCILLQKLDTSFPKMAQKNCIMPL